MNIAVISGSSRPNSQSRKIATWVIAKLKKFNATPALIDLHDHILPTDINLLGVLHMPAALKAWAPIAHVLKRADAFVVIVPEWNGMAPPALMNFFAYASEIDKPLAHKAGHMFAVSSASGGSYPAVQLRVFGPKNNHFMYTPELTIIRNCENVFNALEPEADNSEDQYLQKRALHSLEVFLEYAKALKSMRETTKVNLLEYPNGM